jgi:hypothetical protein
VRTPETPLATDMSPPGVEQKLRLRALRSSWIKDVVQAVAFTAAGIWAIYTFWYRERYLPSVTEANVSAHVQLERLGEKDGTQALRITVSMENPGPAPARILGSTLIARGWRVIAAPPKERPRPAPNSPLERGAVTWIDRTLESRPEVLFNSVAVPESFDGRSNATVRPGGRSEEETVLFLGADSYPYVTVEAQVAWLPLAHPLRKECYALIAQEDGSVSASVRSTAAQGAPPGNCRLSTTTASATIALR